MHAANAENPVLGEIIVRLPKRARPCAGFLNIAEGVVVERLVPARPATSSSAVLKWNKMRYTLLLVVGDGLVN